MELVTGPNTDVPEGLRSLRGRHASAYIYWRNNDLIYPCDGWIDNISIIIGWWIGEVCKILDGESSANFTFMEGPYKLHIITSGADEVECVLHGSDGRWSTSISVIIKQILDATTKMIDGSFDFGISSEEILSITLCRDYLISKLIKLAIQGRVIRMSQNDK